MMNPSDFADAASLKKRAAPGGWGAYSIAVLFTLFAWWARTLLDPYLLGASPFATFYISVAVTAWWCGTRAAALSAFVGALIADYFFAEPRGQWGFQGRQDWLSFVAYALVCSTVILLIFRARLAERRALALHEKERDFRTLANHMPPLAWMTNEVGEVLWCNKRWLDYTGVTVEDLRAMGWQKVHHPEHAERAMEKWLQSLRTGAVWEDTFPLRSKNGSYRWFLSRAIPLRDESGQVVRWFGTNSDVTEQRQSEETARRSREELQAIIDAVPSLIAYINPDCTYRWVNRSYENWFNVQACKIVGRHVRDLAGEETFQIVRSRLERAIAGEPMDYEVFLPVAGGRWVHASYVPHLGANNQVEGVITFVMDISDHRRAEQYLRESEEKFRRIFEAANEGIWILDASARISLVNQRMAEMLGYRQDEMIGRTKSDFAFPDDANFIHDLLERRKNGISEQTDIRFRHRDGHEVWTSMAARPIFDAAGKFAGTLDMISDVTERRRATTELFKAKEQLARMNEELEHKVVERTAKLQEAIEELEHFSYTITHDMRAPLRAMQGFGEILLDEAHAELKPTHKDYLRRIVTASERMDALIRDALNYSKVVREHFELKPLDPEVLLREIIESYPDLHPPQAEIHIESPLPRVLANDAGVTQCFSNLLNNAVKFVRPGERPRVYIWAERRDDSVRIWFEDNGIGIPKQHQEKIFGMFQRLSREYEGTGIGLALVRKVVERMCGQIGVESEAGQGSRFWLEFRGCEECEEDYAVSADSVCGR